MKNTKYIKKIDKSLIYLIILVILMATISIFTGAYNIRDHHEGWRMIFITRIPRTQSLMLTGVAMAMSGIVMQLITQNKLVEPRTTGTIQWAGLGLILAYIIVPSASLFLRTTSAIVFSFLGSMIFFILLRNIKLQSSYFVPILGIMMGAVVSAFTTFIALEFNMSQSLEICFAGSFTQIQRGRYEYLYIIILVTIVIYYLANRLSIIGLGEDVSTNLGLNYKKILLISIAMVSITTGVVASVVGNVPFLGIIVPNIVSMYRGDNLKDNLPYACLSAMLVIIIADLIARTIIAPFEVPVSLILGSIGAIVFLIIVFTKGGKK